MKSILQAIFIHEKAEKKKKPANQPKTAASPKLKSQPETSFPDFAHQFLLLPNQFQSPAKRRKR
jgi:hypothetical protein